MPRINVPGHYFGMGKQVADAVSGVYLPVVDTVPQRGGRVSRRYRDGSLDRPQSDCLPEWVTAVGAWGDVFAAIGNAQHILRQSGQERIGVLYCGFDRDLPRFLRLQPWCREVRHVLPGSPEQYRSMVLRACSTDRELTWLPELLAGTEIDLATVLPAHVDYALQTEPVIHRWHGALLPSEDWRAAARLRRCGGELRTYLLNPVSVQSCPDNRHWPHWDRAIPWLLDNTPYFYVLAGHGWDPRRFAPHPRLGNLVNQLPSMLRLLALASLCDGIITTSNSLSMWSVIEDVPAVVAANADLGPAGAGYFAQWIDAGANQVVPYDADLDAFILAVRRLQSPDAGPGPGRAVLPALRGPGHPLRDHQRLPSA